MTLLLQPTCYPQIAISTERMSLISLKADLFEMIFHLIVMGEATPFGRYTHPKEMLEVGLFYAVYLLLYTLL